MRRLFRLTRKYFVDLSYKSFHMKSIIVIINSGIKDLIYIIHTTPCIDYNINRPNIFHFKEIFTNAL